VCSSDLSSTPSPQSPPTKGGEVLRKSESTWQSLLIMVS
jgi:hypothetical protein